MLHKYFKINVSEKHNFPEGEHLGTLMIMIAVLH